MIEVMNGQGLCMTCNNAPTCFYRATRGPGLFCEMFDDYVPPPVVRPVKRKAPRSSDMATALGATKQDDSAYSGLCMNCDHRGTCKQPKPSWGVWHCENYE